MINDLWLIVNVNDSAFAPLSAYSAPARFPVSSSKITSLYLALRCVLTGTVVSEMKSSVVGIIRFSTAVGIVLCRVLSNTPHLPFLEESIGESRAPDLCLNFN
jgi:hypothetical protein